MNWRRLVLAAVAAWVLSRAIVFSVLLVISQTAFIARIYSNSVWQTRVQLSSERVRPELTRMVMIGDAWWYRAIAAGGYRDGGEWPAKQRAAFFPLFPLLVRTIAVTGDFAVDAVLVSNASFLAALIAVALLAVAFGAPEDEAQRAVFYLAFFPTSYFFSLPMTESLFLLLSATSILGGRSGRWWLAGLAGGLASLTRVNGLLLFPVLLLVQWQQERRLTPRAAWSLLVPAGTAAYMLFLRGAAGDALAFVGAQQSWGRRPGGAWEPVLGFLRNPTTIADGWNFAAFNFAIAVLLSVCAAALLVRREWALGVYTLAMTALPLSSGSLQSMGRYALVVFPLFLWLARLGRTPVADRLITAVSVTGFGFLLTLFALRVDFALS